MVVSINRGPNIDPKILQSSLWDLPKSTPNFGKTSYLCIYVCLSVMIYVVIVAFNVEE